MLDTVGSLSLNQAWSAARGARETSTLSGAGLPSVDGKSKDELKSVAEEFESVFVQQFIDSLWSGLETPAPFGGGHAEGIYRSMLNEQMAQQMTAEGGFGLADQIYRELVGLQETAASGAIASAPDEKSADPAALPSTPIDTDESLPQATLNTEF